MSDIHSDQCRGPTSEPSDNASPEVGPQNGLVCDKEFWFDDGNIVLVVCTDAFRVHKSVLARSSEIFRDLFTVAQPCSYPFIEGCPIVHLSDHPDDVRHLLRALYDGKRFLLGRSEAVAFAEVAALLGLGHKYQIDDLRNAALACMKTCFTNDLAVWQKFIEQGCSSHMQFLMSDAIAVVKLARLTDNPSMLPVALICAANSAHQPSCVELLDPMSPSSS